MESEKNTEELANGTVSDSSKDISEVLKKLDVHNLQADRDIGEDDESVASSLENGEQSSTTNETAASRDSENNHNVSEHSDEDNQWTDAVTYGATAETNESKESIAKSEAKSSGFNLFKMFSSKGKKDKSEAASLDKTLRQVTIDTLPQRFVTKYLGCKRCHGLWGIQNVRQPLEDLVEGLQGMPKGEDLPVMNIQVSNTGLHISEHKANKSKKVNLRAGAEGHIPIEFISYGVQDIRYTRIFTFILVKEMSFRNRLTECHAYLCDSAITARKLALSISKAFRDYAKDLKGKPFKFQVDLRSTQELEEDLAKVPEGQPIESEEEC